MRSNLPDMTITLGSVMRFALAVALVCSLCLPTLPVSAQAATSNLDIQAGSIAEFDLNKSWSSQEGGLDATFTITESGVYYLTSDLESGAGLIVDAMGEDVIIKLNGHTLTINGSGADARKAMISILEAHTVAFDGASSRGESLITSAGKSDMWAITSSAEGCVVSANDLTVKLASRSNEQRNLKTHCIRMTAGSLELSDCTVLMEMGNQALRSSNLLLDSSEETPSAIYATKDVNSVVLNDCTVVGEGPAGFSLDDLSDTMSVGNAYALFSTASSTRVSGGSYRAISLRGNATCISANPLEIEPSSAGSLSLEAGAGQLASGIMSTSWHSVEVNAPVNFSTPSLFAGAAEIESAFRASAEGGFVFGDCVPQQEAKYPVLVMTDGDLSSANGAGLTVGTFDSGLDAAKRTAITAALQDARGDAGACICAMTPDLLRVGFQLELSRAIAQVIDASGNTTSWSTLSSAIEKLSSSPGAMLKLCKDVPTLEISSARKATIDLNGHHVESLDFSVDSSGNAGDGLVVKNGTLGGSSTAVTHRSPLPLALDNVNIEATSSDDNAYGVIATADAGELSISNTKVVVNSSRSSVAGIDAYGVLTRSSESGVVLEKVQFVVRTPSARVGLYGLSSAGPAQVLECEFDLESVNGTACAVYAGSSLAMKDANIDVRTTEASSLACGVWGASEDSKAASVTIDSCAVRVSSDADVADASYACLLGSSSEVGSSLVTWTLAGKTTLACTGRAHLGYNLGGIVLSDGFSLGDGSDSKIRVSQSRRPNDVGVALGGAMLQSSAEDLADIAALFTPSDGSSYEGWQLMVDDDAHVLVWRQAASGGNVVELDHDGAVSGFVTLAAAIRAAQSGDSLKLLADVSECDALAISQDSLSIDLGGHKVRLRARNEAVAGDDADGAALRYSGSGTLKIANGTVAIDLGAPAEGAGSTVYQGVAIVGGGVFDVANDASLQVNYVGSTTSAASQQQVTLRGVGVLQGSFKLDGSLQVSGSPADGVKGAMATYGVFAEPSSDKSASVDIASGATVSVSNNTAALARKNTYYAGGLNGSAQGGPPGLREVVLDPKADEEFYRDVVTAFQRSASYDDPNDSTARNSFSASIYYAHALTLEREGTWYDGLRVWAFSDQAVGSAVGTMAAIQPNHVFTSSGYDTLTETVGVATGEGASGRATITVSGSVSVSGAHGNATALDANGASGSKVSWNCTGARLTATADSSDHALAQGPFDLRDFISFTPKQSEKVAYPGTTGSQLVAYGRASARDVVIADGVSYASSRTTSSCNDGSGAALEAVRGLSRADVYGADFERVSISFANVRNSDGTVANVREVTAGYGQTVAQALAAASAQLPKPADFTSGATKYRFVGWCPYHTTGSPEALLYDGDHVGALEITHAVAGVSASGTLTLRAVYLAVQQNQHLVTFEVDGRKSACVVEHGDFPNYVSANGTNTSYVSPAKIATEVGKTFTFAGWYVDADADGTRASNEVLYSSILPRAYADAAYVSNWSWRWADVTFRFHTKLYDADSDSLLDNAPNEVKTSCDIKTQDAADSIAKIGSVIGYGGKLYKLIGWSTRKTDVEPLYDANNPLPNVTSSDRAMTNSYSRSFYALYEVSDHMVDVTFYDGSTVLGTSGPCIATATTVSEAFAATKAKKPVDKSEQQSFLGWSTKPNDSSGSSMANDTATLENIAGSSATTLSLYASYGLRPRYAINLRDSSGTKVLYHVIVKRGETVQQVLDEQGISASVETQLGKYFGGWTTASGEIFSLDEPVAGSADLYAEYRDVIVTSRNDKDISATVTVPWSVSTKWAAPGKLEDVFFSLESSKSADSPIRSFTARNGYTVLKSYRMQLTTDFTSGDTAEQSGSFGTAQVKVQVDKRYRNAHVRLFWLGMKKGRETVLNSSEKKIGKDGYVTVDIDNFAIGDADEGGNLAVAYMEGGRGNANLRPGGLSGASLKGLSAPGLSGGLRARGLAGGLSNAKGKAANGIGGKSAAGSGDSAGAAEDGESEGSSEAEVSNAVALVLVVAALLAIVARVLWKLLVVRPRRKEEEAEFPTMADLYSKGLTF